MKSKLPENWKIKKINETKINVTDYVANGSFKSLKDNVKYLDEPSYAVLIRLTDFNNSFKGDFRFLSKESYNFLSKTKLYGEEVIISNVGAYSGTVFKCPKLDYKMSLGPNAVVLKIDPKDQEFVNDFVYYWFKGRFGQWQINSIISGSAQPKFNKTNFRELEIPIPRLQEQKAIADTLSALDHKIELNNKINENLEQQAQTIFKHWFVDFEFSNEEGKPYKSNGGEMVESELGLIPKGWNIDKLGKNKLGNLVRSGIKEFTGEKIYLATADVADSYIVNEEVKITIEERPSRANMQPKPNTVWFAKMKDSRKLILVDELDYELQKNYIFSTGFAGLQASKDSVCYLWTYLQSERFDITKNSLCTGTTMQSINNSNINRMKIVIPPNEILSSYNQIVRPMFRKIVNNRYENRTLAKLRDTLLPKLMSGEIRIPLG